MRKILFFFISLFILTSCGGDSDNNVEEQTAISAKASIITSMPTITQGTIKFNGNVKSVGSGYHQRGFCWSTNINPTISNSDYVSENTNTLGEFSLSKTYSSYVFSTETTYYLRAYLIINSSEVVYGENITFTTPPKLYMNEKITKDIYTTSAILNAETQVFFLDAVSPDEIGFCYRTSAGVDITNGQKITTPNPSYLSTTNISLETTVLLPNTTYYVKAYSKEGAKVYYSNEYTFKTAGAIGTSGGYIYYDKGETTDGWRYLEAAPANIVYNGSNKIYWGCSGTMINQTQAGIGFGPANTVRIMQQCPDANCAARLCDSYTINGVSDWFLPSQEELKAFYKSSKNVFNIATSPVSDKLYWSSTESGNSTSAISLDGYLGYTSESSKNYNMVRVRPVRRF